MERLTIRELISMDEMIQYMSVLQDLYPSLEETSYRKELEFMLQHNYGQVAVFDGEICVGISGYWIGNKIWCGKYLEMDNLNVLPEYRSKGAGKLIADFLNQKAIDENCSMVALDSYTTNYKAHRFFYNQGFAPKGFHFIKILKEEKIR